MTQKGRFITLEGGEGVGKSSLLRTLADSFRAHGIPLVTTREPGGTTGANRIRDLFALHDDADPWLPKTEAFLICAARAQHLGRLIKPMLDKGTWVLCDRFTDSTRVYQGILGGIDEKELEALMHMATGGLTPDCTLILDCDPKVALLRLAAVQNMRQDPVTRFDTETFERHEHRRRAFRSLAQRFPDRCHLVDASRTPLLVQQESLEILKGAFKTELATLGIKGHTGG